MSRGGPRTGATGWHPRRATERAVASGAAVLCASACLAFGVAPGAAQEIPRGEYLRQVPINTPRLVPQTEASRELALFGDASASGYVDVDPVDGIDDRRHAVLMSLAERFAPYLVQNTDNIPVSFTTYMANRDTFPLFVDTWDVGGSVPTLFGSSEVNFSALGADECAAPSGSYVLETRPEPTTDPEVEDCKVLELMARYTPGAGITRPLDELLVRRVPSRFDVLFFDFPGNGAGSWDVGYAPEFERTPEARRASFAQALVHPFLLDVSENGRTGYELVLQYWFFYPSNDSGMDHEGDWEHLNVIASPRSMVAGPLTAETVRAILDGSISASDRAPDPLVIKRLDFYFHNSVMPLDFSSPNVYASRDAWEAEKRSRPEVRFREAELWNYIRYLAYADDDETVVNTHPVGYIGSDNKGLNQALELPGPRNKNAHGTYPLPGRYNNVGPGGTTDELPLQVDPREVVSGIADGSLDGGPTFEGGEILSLADPDRLRIVPDWERIAGPARESAAVRADWAWLLLPIHWGYPATRSPFAGVIEHYNTGNNSPPGPSFNGGWNASRNAPGFNLYEPHTLPAVLPLQIQDNFRNDLGFMNLTGPLILNLPPLDFVVRLALYPFRLAFGQPERVFYPNETLPFRFFGISSGVSYERMDEDFSALALNRQQFTQFRDDLIDHLVVNGFDSTTMILGGDDGVASAIGTFLQLPFYLGGHFTSENTVRNVRSDIFLRIDFSNIPSYTYDADINYWEYAGSLRYSVLTGPIQPFLKVGYGWAWYRLENVRTSAGPFDPVNSDWIGPGIFPNVWHYGLGVELVPWRRIGLIPGGVEIALRLEYGRYNQSLGIDFSDISLSDLGTVFSTLGDIPDDEGLTRNDFVLGLALTF